MGFLFSNVDCVSEPAPKESSCYDTEYMQRCIRCPTPPEKADWDYKKPENTRRFRTLRKVFTLNRQPKLRSLFRKKENSACTLTERYSGEEGFSRLVQDMDSISGTLTLRSAPKEPERLRNLFKSPSRRGSAADLTSQYSNPYEAEDRQVKEEAAVKRSKLRRFFKIN